MDVPASAPTFRESLLILSDVHLGHDLASKVRSRPAALDGDLVRLLDHYRVTPPSGDRWRLVIAGDFIDFIGMVVPSPIAGDASGYAVETEPSDEEREHGLGNAADHARVKLRLCARRHPEVFAALAAFVAEGHTLSLVHGNHDVEFYWEVVQREFRDILWALASARRGAEPADFDGRIEFHTWFYYDGVAYIEHGHQYDRFCANDHVMAPLSPIDPRRIARGFCDVLLRYIVRPTGGMSEHGHEDLGVLDYFAMGFRLGLGGAFTLALRFARAVVELFRLRKMHIAAATRAFHDEHRRRIAVLAEKTRLGLDRLEALAALQARPITSTIRGILASVLLDQIALALVSGLLVAVLVVLAIQHARPWPFWAASGAVFALAAALRTYLARQRKVDPAEELFERAGQLSRLFPAAFVVMGHTHIPARAPVNDGASTYVNLGSWAEDDTGLDAAKASHYRSPRTHLVIRADASGARGELLTWDSDGPRSFRSPLVTPSLPPPKLDAPV